MLDLMRRKKRLKIVLWLVIFGLSIGMLLFFVPGQNMGPGDMSASAASVDGVDIPMREYVDTFQRFVQSYAADGRNKTDPETLRALGIDKEALGSLISVRVIENAAQRMGLKVTPQEVREAIESNPAFQDRGAFIGAERYKLVLASNRISVTQFEEGVRQMLYQKKLRNLISTGMLASEKDLRDEYIRTNLEAQVRFVLLKLDDYKKKVTPTEAELRAYFEANKSRYNIGEQRRIQFVLLSLAAAADTMEVTDQEVQEAWDRQKMEEMVTASHILFEVKDPAKEAEVKARAEAILKRAKGGEDFANLAKEHSDDAASKAQGGDLGAFPRGRMAKEFEDAAFALQPGQISSLVRTSFGFHIIKVARHDTPTLEGMRISIRRSVQIDKASDWLRGKTVELQKLGETEKDLAVIAKTLGRGTAVNETGFFGNDVDPVSLGVTRPFIDEAFRLKEIGEVGRVVEHPIGWTVLKLLEVRQSKPPDFTVSREKVRTDYVAEKASELIRAEASRIATEASKSQDLEKAAKSAGLTAKMSQKFKLEGAPDPDLGAAPTFNRTAFDLKENEVSSPIELEGGNRYAIIHVVSRTPFDEAAYTRQKPELRERLVGVWRDTYFQEYVKRLVDEMEKSGKIRINPDAFAEATRYRSAY